MGQVIESLASVCLSVSVSVIALRPQFLLDVACNFAQWFGA